MFITLLFTWVSTSLIRIFTLKGKDFLMNEKSTCSEGRQSL